VPKRNVPRLGMSCDIGECPSLADCFYTLIFLVHIYLTDGVQSMDPGVDMLFSVVLGTLFCYLVWFSECWHAGLRWSMTLHLTCWSFFSGC
jgi:hypothetical protein